MSGIIKFILTGDASGLEKAKKDGEKSLKDLRVEFNKGVLSAAKWGAGITTAAAAAVAAFTASGIKMVSTNKDVADALNGTVNGLKALRMAAADHNIDGLDGSLNRLNRRLGAVEMGGGPAVETVKRLGLNLQELAGLDVDEKAAVIADRIVELGMSSEEAARHLQQLGFEQASAVNLFMQGGDAIRGYRADVDALGLSMSNVDAEMVRQASNAMGVFGDVADSVKQTLAVEFSPMLSAIAEQFKQAAVESGGFSSAIQKGVNIAIKTFGILMDTVRGVQVAAKGLHLAGAFLGEGWVQVTSRMVESFANFSKVVIDRMRAVTGGINTLLAPFGKAVDTTFLDSVSEGLGGVQEKMAETREKMAENRRRIADELHELAMQEMPSDAIDRWVENARDRARELAEEAEAARRTMGAGGAEAGGLSDQERADLERRIEEIRKAGLSETEAINEKYAEQNAILAEALENNLLTEAEWFELSKQAKEQQESELTRIEEEAAKARERIAEMEAKTKQRIWKSALSSLTTLMNSESRKMFEIGKVAGISQSLIATWQGASEALKLGWPLGPPAATAITLAGLANVAKIRGQSFGGGGSGGGAASATQQINANAEPVAAEPSRHINISLEGERFGRNQVRDLIGAISEELNDGVTWATN